jgi:hypothetical protein
MIAKWPDVLAVLAEAVDNRGGTALMGAGTDFMPVIAIISTLATGYILFVLIRRAQKNDAKGP